jgi:transposase
MKRQTLSLLSVVFPELEQVISDPFNVTGLALLEKYPTARHYDYASCERILKTFRGIKGNNFNEAKANRLLALARESIYSGVAKEARAVSIRTNVEHIRLLNNQIEHIDTAVMELLEGQEIPKSEQVQISELIDNLRTIPGIGDRTILSLLAECGDLNRFHNPKALTGYLGLYPTLEQSGSSVRHGRLAKRGARLAKKAMYLAAIAAVRHNAQMQQVYRNYRSKGRAKKECIIIVARKLLQIIYILYTKNIPYDPSRVFVAKPTS